MTVRVGLAQIAPFKAEIDRNLDAMAEAIRQASAEGVDLVTFAETAVSGYFLEGGVLECAMSGEELAERLGKRLAGLERGVDVHTGFYEMEGGQVYNSAAYLEFGVGAPRVVDVYRKFFLPTYGVFDEERFVARGHGLGLIETRFGKVGALICEDVWHSILPTLLALRGAQILLIPSASPGRGFSGATVGNLDRYHRMLQAVSEEHGVFCVNTQLIGFEGGKGFVGGSSVTDPFGKRIAEGPVQEPHLLIADLDLDQIEIARHNLPLLADLRGVWDDVLGFAQAVE